MRCKLIAKWTDSQQLPRFLWSMFHSVTFTSRVLDNWRDRRPLPESPFPRQHFNWLKLNQLWSSSMAFSHPSVAIPRSGPAPFPQRKLKPSPLLEGATNLLSSSHHIHCDRHPSWLWHVVSASLSALTYWFKSLLQKFSAVFGYNIQQSALT